MKYSNEKSKTSDKAKGAPVGNILAMINCIGILGQVKAFSDWVSKNHHVELDKELLEGYKFTFDVLFGRLFDEIGLNSSLNLKEDMWLSRALFAGIPISKVPNNSEKAVLLRNIYCSANNILRARDSEEIITCFDVFLEKVLARFRSLSELATASPTYSVKNAEEALTYASIFEIYIFLNDTRRGRPHGLPLSWYNKEIPLFWESRREGRAYFKYVFKGYKYALQFLWYQLLKDNYNASVLVHLGEAKNWAELDEFFDKIRESIIAPLERQTKAEFGFDSILLVHLSGKDIFGRLIQNGPPEKRLTKKDSIDRLFFWHDIELIDASDFGFNGVASFVPALVGSVQIRKDLKSNDKIHIIKLVHPPEDTSERHDFSYGIFISVGSTTGLSDASGWLLFYDCCSDRGSASSGYKFAEDWLSRYAKKGIVDMQEMIVGKKQFLKLMKHRLISMTKEEMFSLEGRTKSKNS